MEVVKEKTNEIKTIIVPHAGGLASNYLSLNKKIKMNSSIFEYAGRGERSSSSIYKSISDASDDLLKFVHSIVGEEREYILFGHSMGALVILDCIYKLQERGHILPKHIFFSGLKSPQTKESTQFTDDFDLKKHLYDLGGTSKVVLENEELWSYMKPIIHNDFKIIDEYIYLNQDKLIMVDFTILYGSKENFNMHDIYWWNKQKGKTIQYYKMTGDHFFIFKQENEVAKLINSLIL